MTSRGHYVTHSTAVHLSEMILNLLIVAMIIAIGILLFTY
jgi:hypothetical protein